jgi:hypothetical protein
VGCAVAASPEPARDLLSPATLTPSTAAGGADAERWTEEPAASAAATSTSSKLVQFTLQRGAQCATGSGSLAIRSTSPYEVRESK